MLSETDLLSVLREGALLALDANAVWGSRLREVVDAVASANTLINHPRHLQVVVPANVHAEMSFALRRRFGDSFSDAKISDLLAGWDVAVVDFTRDDAMQSARWLHRQLRGDGAWQLAKKGRIAAWLGVESGKLPAKRVPATVDWYVAGHAAARGWLLVTDDKGLEFDGLDLACRYDDLLVALRRLANA